MFYAYVIESQLLRKRVVGNNSIETGDTTY